MQTSHPSDIQVRCPHCRRRLCNRIKMHNDSEEVWGLYIKHRKMEILTPEIIAIFTCPNCESKIRINSNTGVEKCLTT